MENNRGQQIIPSLSGIDKTDIVPVNSFEQLTAIVAQWSDLEWLAVDTEFERRTSFYAKLALVQIFDGTKIYLIDPFATECPARLRSLFENPDVVKIFHSSKEDLEVLYTAWNCRVKGLFDTQVAYSFLTGEISLGYAKITEMITGIFVDKQETTSDWCKRPLAQKQLDYAAKDVLYLPEIYQNLSAKIAGQSYYDYFRSECDEYTLNAITRIETFADYREASDVWRLNGDQLSLFKILFEWREKTARLDDRTRNHIIKDPELVRLAEVQPIDLEQLKKAVDLHPRSVRLYGEDWIRMIKGWQTRESVKLPLVLNPRDVKGLKQITENISKIVEKSASDHNLSRTLLFSKRLIRKLAFSVATGSEPPLQWSGWRKLLLNDLVYSNKIQPVG